MFFFIGSTEEILLKIETRFKQDYPNIKYTGHYSPPFKDNYSEYEIDEMLDVINMHKPSVLWVGMTAPKQEKWIFNNLHRLDVNFIAAIGAVFDFYSGNISRSNNMFQKIGLEWLYRLITQPKKMWRRTVISSPIFIYHVIKKLIY